MGGRQPAAPSEAALIAPRSQGHPSSSPSAARGQGAQATPGQFLCSLAPCQAGSPGTEGCGGTRQRTCTYTSGRMTKRRVVRQSCAWAVRKALGALGTQELHLALHRVLVETPHPDFLELEITDPD